MIQIKKVSGVGGHIVTLGCTSAGLLLEHCSLLNVVVYWHRILTYLKLYSVSDVWDFLIIIQIDMGQQY